jgi:hypothetical protein
MAIEIKLTKGEVAIISDKDADLAKWKWRLCDSNRKRFGADYTCYAKCWVSKEHAANSPYSHGQTIRLHRVILERELGRLPTTKEHADHKNRNGLDNRRENIKLADNSQNSMNSRKPRPRGNSTYGTRSKYKGVSRYKDKRTGNLGGYYGCVGKDGKNYYVRGNPSSEIKTAMGRDKLALKLHEEFATLNFPELKEQYLAEIEAEEKILTS